MPLFYIPLLMIHGWYFLCQNINWIFKTDRENGVGTSRSTAALFIIGRIRCFPTGLQNKKQANLFWKNIGKKCVAVR